ncbi:MAG TPA: DUF1080 domain-containing protein [Fimbriimonadaceae bacterium]|nr:DUF1080 domain-containing protein [Fimbriimonadaceae bacterium]
MIALVAAATLNPWIPLFNGKDLDGWTPKIKGYELGRNYGNTFRVRDGKIIVAYDWYGGKFANKFGHLFYKEPFSHYRLKVEYRFVGEQLPDGPGWAYRNSGVMVHGQDPKTIRLDQDFPVSIEFQFLGAPQIPPTSKPLERHTGNLCTPGTNVVLGGKLHTQHCTDSTSATIFGDLWATAEIEVHGSGKITHFINGVKVLEYEQPQYDPNDADAKGLIKDGDLLINEGTISLQSESHPIEFRKVELRRL